MDFFDLFSNILTAYVSGVFIIVGLGVALLGIFIAYSETFSSKTDKIITATIAGVRLCDNKSDSDSQTLYYPVFEYVGEDGQIKQVESLSGSSYLRNKIPGTRLKIRLSSNKDGWASPVGMAGIYIGLTLMLFGLAFVGAGASFVPKTTVTLCVWGIAVLHLGNKLRKIVIPKNLRETKEQWRARITKEDDTSRKFIPMLGRQDVVRMLRKLDTTQQITTFVSMLVALGMMYGGYYFYDKEQKFIETAVLTDSSGYSRDSSGEYTQLTYTDQNGQTHTGRDAWSHIFLDNQGSNEAQVYYSPQNPDDFVVARGRWQSGLYKVLMGLGGIIFVSNLMSYFRLRNRLSQM